MGCTCVSFKEPTDLKVQFKNEILWDRQREFMGTAIVVNSPVLVGKKFDVRSKFLGNIRL